MGSSNLDVISRGAHVPKLQGCCGVHPDPHQHRIPRGLHPTLLGGRHAGVTAVGSHQNGPQTQGLRHSPVRFSVDVVVKGFFLTLVVT